MKTTYELGPARLKIAIEAYMKAIGKPVSISADAFNVDAEGKVTVVIEEPDDNLAVPVVVVVPTAPVLAIPTAPGAVLPVVPGMTVVPALPGHMVTADPPFSATGIDTEFGYKDVGDNGIGFFIDPATGKPYDTNNQTLVGISLPREVLMSTFVGQDDWRTRPTLDVWKENASLVQEFARKHKITANVDGGGKSLRGIPLVDAGPTRTTGNLVDLTDAAATALGTGGKAICTFELLKDGVPMELRGIDFVKGIVG
jgi:hypothetical protein